MDKKYDKKLKPFVKWVGGKGQLLKEIRKSYPIGLGDNIMKYAEPFVGGGAVLFDILSRYKLKEVYISDINLELINTYIVIRDDVETLISKLTQLEKEYIPLNAHARKKYYYEKRERYNQLLLNGNIQNSNLEKAALFIFLNKTCFNGLYRVNKKGLFNVPAGSYKNPLICDSMNLKNISKAIKNVIIRCADYQKSDAFIDKNTFVYFDPPYRPLTKTANFTSYTEKGFGEDEQIELAEFVNKLSYRGAKVVVSNSDPKNSDITDDFFENLYDKQTVIRVQASRMINCKSDDRGRINELLIVNY
ncbi:MAG: DNA adenine methylase [Eubacteriaceae bacterium]|jgi:DNA adenine methylase|nr:DNA adenine methylase [Eubacteriaceae bacterium]